MLKTVLLLICCGLTLVCANTIVTVAGTGTYGYTGDNIAAISARLYSPFSVAFDNSGNMYIADTSNNRVRKVDTNGIITTVAGTGIVGYNGDNIAATSAQLYGPTDLAVDNSGNLFIVDQSNSRVRKVDVNGIITTFAGNGVATYNGDNRAATSASLKYPNSVAIDTNGNVYICDRDNYRVRKVDTNGIITTVAGTGVKDYNGDNTAATLSNVNPWGIALDANGNLYIADGYNYRVRKVDTNGIITTVAGTGIGGYNGDNIASTSAQLSAFDVAVDKSGNLYIAESYNYRVRKVDTNGIITTVAGTGIASYNGDNIAATSATLNNPFGVSVDKIGAVYIADTSNHRVRKVSALVYCYGNANTDVNVVCSSHGQCVATDTCVCSNGYTGNNCQFAICNGIAANETSVCSSHGQCQSPNQCTCSNGYTGFNCENAICFGKSIGNGIVCSNHGSCSSPNHCTCEFGYTGNECSDSCSETVPEVMIKNLGGSLSFQVTKSTNATKSSVYAFVLPSADDSVESLDTLMQNRLRCSSAPTQVPNYWSTSSVSSCDKQSSAIVSFADLSSNCAIQSVDNGFFSQYTGQLRVVQVDADGSNQIHYKYNFDMSVQTRMSIVADFQVSVAIVFKLLLQIYRAPQHALFVRFQITSSYPGLNPIAPSLSQVTNVQSVQIVQESITCTNQVTCTQVFAMTMVMQPLSCSVKGNMRINFEDSEERVDLQLASENVCLLFNEQATFNGTMTTHKASNGIASNSFLLGERVSAKINLLSQYPIQNVVFETMVLCATTDSTVSSCTSAQVSQLLKSTYFIVNEMTQQANTVVNTATRQIDFDLLYNHVYTATKNARHILEVAVRVTLGNLQQEMMERKEMIALQWDSHQNTLAAKKPFTNELNIVEVQSGSAVASVAISVMVLVLLVLL